VPLLIAAFVDVVYRATYERGDRGGVQAVWFHFTANNTVPARSFQRATRSVAGDVFACPHPQPTATDTGGFGRQSKSVTE